MKNKEQQERKFKNFMRTRLFIVAVIVLICMCALIGRLIYINTEKGDSYAKIVLSQQLSYKNSPIPYERGSIYDRNGVILAKSKKVYNVILEPANVNANEGMYVEGTVAALTDIFGFDESEIRTVLKDRPDSFYVILKKHVSYEEVAAFKERKEEDHKEKIEIAGVTFEEEYVREYPAGSLASHVIGFTNSGNEGAYGIEQYYNDELNGTDGKQYGYYDDELNAQSVYKEPINGNNIVSTIDYNIQTAIEKHVKAFRENTGCNNIGVIIMDPNNGEVLGMTSNDEFDLNSPRDLSSVYSEEEINSMTDEEKAEALYSMWKNFCISSTYEPGSTFKTITVASALEEDVISENSTFECEGSMEKGGWKINCNNLSGHGRLSLAESLMKSCNCALMEIADRFGADNFFKYQNNFGFGRKTGIDLIGEEKGIIIDRSKLNETELATSSFGTTFNVTMIQMAAAYCSILNGGNYYRPHVVKEIQSSEGDTIKKFDNELERVTVSRDTTDFIRKALLKTVEEGTATPAQVEGYLIGGKTGTAQKRPRTEKRYVVSFAGSAPANDPEIFIYVVIDEVHDPELAGSSSPATKLTSEILSDILPYAGVYPEGEIKYNVDLSVVPEGEKDIVVGDLESEDGYVVHYNSDEDESNPDVVPEDYDED